jgi:clan AA aspartic protease
MGTFNVTFEVGTPAPAGFQEVNALVDTGASYTTLPATLLRSLGVEPHARRNFTLATGDLVQRDLGRTWVKIDGQTEMTMVVFGDDAALPLLGAVTLEEFGLGVDPVAKKLISVPGLLARTGHPGT